MSLACLARNKSECGEEDSPAKAQRRQGKSENFFRIDLVPKLCALASWREKIRGTELWRKFSGWPVRNARANFIVTIRNSAIRKSSFSVPTAVTSFWTRRALRSSS